MLIPIDDDRLMLAIYFQRADDAARGLGRYGYGETLQGFSYRVDHGLPDMTAVILALGRLVAARRLYWHHNFGFILPEDAPAWMVEEGAG